MGRPRVAWTPARKRKLARLYALSDESVPDICELLQDGEFQPQYVHVSDRRFGI
jgi:hypothetical protein